MGLKPQRPSCRRCGQVITGTCVQALGSDWHPACWRCEACGAPLDQTFVARGGKGYHPACHETRFGLRCSVCGEVIRGSYFQQDGKPVCERDYRTTIGARCWVCDEALVGTFVQNAFGQKSCARHRQPMTCTSCLRWLNPTEQAKGLYAPFGTPLCDSCGSFQVNEAALGPYTSAFGTEAMALLGLRLKPLPPLSLRLETITRIRDFQNPIEAQAEGITRTFVESSGSVETRRGIQEIVIVGGLAREHFEGVLAHEFGHVWLFQERLDAIRGAPAEGFCELVKHLWLTKLGTPLALALKDRMALNPDPIYGEGFRGMKLAWEQQGLPGVLDRLRR